MPQTEEDLGEILELQERQYKLTQSEHARVQEALARRAVSPADLETAENAMVAALTAVRQTRNELALIAIRQELARAALDAAMAQWEKARRDRARCEIRLPVDARCASRTIEVSQYVARGQSLGRFVDVSSIEVVAMLELRQIRALFPEGIKSLGPVDLRRLMDPQKSIFNDLRIPVEASWGAGEEQWIWPGRVVRLAGALDPATRTVGVIIEVPDPYKDIRPAVRPPLIPDVFCEATIYGETVEAVVIPREALHDDRVYLLRDGKLHIRKVTVLAQEKELAVISEGLETGDAVILADLVALTGRPSAGTETFPASKGPFPAMEGIPLRGRKVKNPVSPRTGTRVEFPAGMFEEAGRPAAAGDTEGSP